MSGSLDDVDVEKQFAVDAASVTEAEREHQKAGLAMIHVNGILPTTPGETRPTTTRKELWAYYLYSGLGPYNFGSSQMQDLMYLAGYDPDVLPVGSAPCGDGSCYLPWAGGAKPVTSVILDVSGIQFACQVVLLIFLGSFADYGRWHPAITIVATVISVGINFGWLGATDASQWKLGIALNILSLCMFTVAVNFFTGAMPGLARDLPEIKASEEETKRGDLSIYGYGVISAYCNGWVVLLCIPWFFMEQAAKQIWQLKQTLIYLVASILLGDALNTAVTSIWTPNLQAWYGLVVNPFQQLSATMIVTSAIIADAKGNTSMAVAFLLPTMLVGMVVLAFVDFDKSKIECQAFIEKEARDLYHKAQSDSESSPSKED
ncbi:hypothetical protein RQP46_000577 [Phenoliferia psychrophenolica]